MTQPVTTKVFFEEMAKNGAFNALVHFVETGAISAERAKGVQGKLFDVFLLKAREAQNEVRRIEAVLSRIALISEGGKRPHTWTPRDPRVIDLAREVTTFDNWVMSLYETDLTMIRLANPERGRAKPLEMAKAMDALWEKRLAGLDLGLSDPSLFKRG